MFSGKYVDVSPVNLTEKHDVCHAIVTAIFTALFTALSQLIFADCHGDLRVRRWSLWVVCGNGDSEHNDGMDMLMIVAHTGCVVAKRTPWSLMLSSHLQGHSLRSNHRQKLCRISRPGFLP